jgi:hypothetical protein
MLGDPTIALLLDMVFRATGVRVTVKVKGPMKIVRNVCSLWCNDINLTNPEVYLDASLNLETLFVPDEQVTKNELAALIGFVCEVCTFVGPISNNSCNNGFDINKTQIAASNN